MARAAALRLRQALEEYVAENKGDNPRGHARGVNADLVRQAESLLGGMGPGEAAADTPGRRVAAGSPGRTLDSAKERARELLAPHANGAAAGDGEL